MLRSRRSMRSSFFRNHTCVFAFGHPRPARLGSMRSGSKIWPIYEFVRGSPASVWCLVDYKPSSRFHRHRTFHRLHESSAIWSIYGPYSPYSTVSTVSTVYLYDQAKLDKEVGGGVLRGWRTRAWPTMNSTRQLRISFAYRNFEKYFGRCFERYFGR